jgi:hypothetical protein
VPRQSRKGLDDQRHSEYLWRAIDELDGVEPLTPVARKADVRLCDHDDCLYPRHYDVVARLANRERLLTPTYDAFASLADGRLVTEWGDILPSVADSEAHQRLLRDSCPPHGSVARAPLTAVGVSKIGFDYRTGCWPVNNYYSRNRTCDPTQNDVTQWEGYGRLSIRKHLADMIDVDARDLKTTLAHRVLWIVMGGPVERGRVLNHLCGHRPCANPLHIEQVTQPQNIEHGHAMRVALARIASGQMAFDLAL